MRALAGGQPPALCVPPRSISKAAMYKKKGDDVRDGPTGMGVAGRQAGQSAGFDNRRHVRASEVFAPGRYNPQFAGSSQRQKRAVEASVGLVALDSALRRRIHLTCQGQQVQAPGL